MNTKNLFAALIVLTAITTTAFAQPPRGQEGRGHEGPPPSHPIVDAIDQNQDHEISATEIENASRNLLRLDKNNDGVLNEEDLGHAGRSRSGRQGGQRGEQGQRGQRRPGGGDGEGNFASQLLEFDENGNGKLEKDELPERMQRMIDHNDTDGDGVLDQDELQALEGGGAGQRGGRGEGGQRGGNGGQRDGGNRQRGGGEGGDGGSRAERFVERAMEFDANEDGLLSEEELTEMASNMPQRGGRGGGQGGAGGQRGGGGGGGGGQRGGGRAGGRPE